jgi:tetratricopeptide (TPR) repeat protein
MGDQDACWVKAHALFELVQFADREQAKRMLAQSLALARKAGNRWMVWVALYSQGWMALDGDSPGEARQLFQESLATIRDLGIPGVPALVLTTLARLERLQGRATQAEEEMREAVADYQAVGDWAGVARSLHLLAFLWVTQSQYAQARSLVEQSVSIREELGYREDVAEPLTTLGICAMHLGEYEQAHLRFHASLNIAREFNQRREVARALCCLGAEALAREAYGEAQDWIQQSLVFYQGSESTSLSEYPVELAWTLACLGIAERALGHPQAALEHLRAALPLAARMREDPIVTATTLGGMALTCMDNGHGERATALYALASQEAGPSRWWYDVVGRHVQGAIAALPPEVVQMAQQRGRAQDLWVTARELLEELTSL